MITPHTARLILACMGETTGSIRPGQFTALERIELTQWLREIAEKDGGE